MKILLINPPPRNITYESIIVPPLGLAYLAAVLEKNGYKVTILDAFAEQLTWEIFEDRVAYEKAEVIGIGGMTPVIDNTFKAIKICRNYTDYMVMGGPHLSAYKEEIFKQCPQIDFGIYGEGEDTFVELVEKLEKGEDISKIKGLITKERINEPRELIADLDNLPFPARHLLPNPLYRYILSSSEVVTTMFTSRGCPYQCIFCDKSIFGSQWRDRSAQNIIAEIEQIVNDYGIKSIIIYDDLFTVKKDRVIEICQGIIEKKLEVDWKCEGRVNLVSEETLHWMKKAGCSMIAYGVESGNQKGLDYLNKNVTTEQIKRAFKLTNKAKIKTMAYFILGLPVETYKDSLNTIKFAKEINPTYAQFSILSPMKGTKVYDEAIQKGWYQEIDAQNPLDKDLKRPAIISENWTEEKMGKIIKIAHQKFYFRISYIIKKILTIKSIKEIKSLFKTGFNMLGWYIKGRK